MADFAELKADVGYELIRDDLTDRLPRFVRQATQMINREIRVSDMEKRARAFGNGTRYLPSPNGFLEMRRLWNVRNSATVGSTLTRETNRTAIQQVSPGALQPNVTGGRWPYFFCVHRGSPPELEFDVILADDREVEMVYYERYAEFENDTDTNFLLDNHYSLYLEAATHFAAKAIHDTEEAALRLAAYAEAKREVFSAERRQAYAQPMAATPAHNSVG